MRYNYEDKVTCPICGKTSSWCGHGEGQNGPIAYCGRVSAEKGTVVQGSDGNQWVAIRTKGEMYCGFGLLANEQAAKEKYRQEWIEEQKRSNPNWRNFSPKKTPAPTIKNIVDLGSQYDRGRYKRETVEASTDSAKLNRVYRAFLSCLVLEPEHEKALRTEWGNELFEKITAKNPIKSIPMADGERYSYGKFSKSPWRKAIIFEMLNKGISKEELIGVPGFYQYKDDMTFYKLSGIAFPIYDTKGNIVRLRVRDDFPSAKGSFEEKEGNFYYSSKLHGWCFRAAGDSDEELVYQPKSKNYKVKLKDGTSGVPIGTSIDGKYKNFSSYKEEIDDENKVIKNLYKNGCQSGSFASLYCNESDDYTIAFFTEGEKKAMVANTLLRHPCVSFPGVGTFKKAFSSQINTPPIVEELIQRGMKKAILVYDADKETNIHVLQAEQKCIKEFLNRGIQIAIGEWNPKYGKGLDDILLKGIRPMLYDVN